MAHGKFKNKQGNELYPKTDTDSVFIVVNGAAAYSLTYVLLDMEDDHTDIITNYASKMEMGKWFQKITTTITNRGIVYRGTVSKSSTTSRALNITAGRVFMNGRPYPLYQQSDAAVVPENSGSSAATAIIYLILENNAMVLKTTALNGSMPDEGIEIARASIPAANTASADAYLSKVTITETARREPGWPHVQKTPPTVNVVLNKALSSAEYVVHADINSYDGVNFCDVEVQSKLNNGFKLVYPGNADNLEIRMLVEQPDV